MTHYEGTESYSIRSLKMVLLTMTPLMVDGLRLVQARDSVILSGYSENKAESAEESESVSLSEPAVGKPIAHSQVLDLWRSLGGDSTATTSDRSCSLEALLVGARVYVPPKPPRPEPSPEYKALMAQLRRDEEARAYERMVRPPDAYDTSAFAQVHRPTHATDMGDDDVTLSDINRQAMLVLNFVLTMAGVAYALWVLARWWPTPSRLFLAMGGSVLVGLAEYGLYAGYVWHLLEASKKDKAVEAKEVKEVVQTWVVSSAGDRAGLAPGEDARQGRRAVGRSVDDDDTRETAVEGHAEVMVIPKGPTQTPDEKANVRRRKKRETQEPAAK